MGNSEAPNEWGEQRMGNSETPNEWGEQRMGNSETPNEWGGQRIGNRKRGPTNGGKESGCRRFAPVALHARPNGVGRPHICVLLTLIRGTAAPMWAGVSDAREQLPPTKNAQTRNQALNAIVFLYKKVLKIDVGDFGHVRANRPKNIPVVMTVEEVDRVLDRLQGTRHLLAELRQ